MNKSWKVFRHEVMTLIGRFSFWFGALGVPVIAFLLYAGVAAIKSSQGGETGQASPIAGVEKLFQPAEIEGKQGYVDLPGLARAFPEGFPRADWIAYPDDAAARQALDAGKISDYIVIPADYVQSGKLMIFAPDISLIATGSRVSSLRGLLEYNLLQGNQELFAAVQDPLLGLEEVNLAPPARPERDQDSALTFILPYVMMMLSFMAIMGSATLMLNSVAKEKENRIMEVLMVSTRPQELLLGKIAGLGMVGLFQVLIWGTSAWALLQLSGQTFAIPQEFLLHPIILVWAVVFFVLGYLVYASLMAGIGALVPNLREASQATMLVSLPMMLPLFLISALISQPSGGLAVFFSLFPLTAPMTMMLRLSATEVPLWQVLLSVALLCLAAILTVRAVAGLFRAQTIMSGQGFNIKRFARALAGKE